MTALQGAVESAAPVSRLHAQFSEGDHIRPAAVGLRATRPAAHLVYVLLAVPAPGRSLRAPVVDETVPMPPK